MRGACLVLASCFAALGPAARAAPATMDIDVMRPPHAVSALALGPRDGALYVGGFQEIFRYDGLIFTPVAQPPLTTGRWVAFLAPLGARQLLGIGGEWDTIRAAGAEGEGVRTGVEPWRLSEGAPRFAAWPLEEGLQVLAVAADGDDVWAGTSRGLVRISARGLERWGSGLPPSEPVHAVAARGGRVFASTRERVWALADRRFVSHSTIEGVRHLALTDAGTLWAATARALHRLAPDEAPARASFTPGGEDGGVIFALLAARNGEIWVGTSHGLSKLGRDGAPVEHFGRDAGLPDERVLSLAEDETGALWAGTRVGGLVRLRPSLVENLGAREGLSERITAVLATCDGATWTLGEAGLSRFREGSPTRTWRTGSELSSRERRALAPAAPCTQDTAATGARGAVLLAPAEGPLELVAATGNVTLVERPAAMAGRLHGIFAGNRDGLWMVAESGSVARARFTGDEAVRALTSDLALTARDGVCAGRPHGASVDAEGGLWLATDAGITHVEAGGAAHCTSSAPGLPRANLQAVMFDGERLWVGARDDGGIFVGDTPAGPFHNTTASDGLYCDSIFALVDDGGGGLWSTCGHGVQWVEKRALIDRARGGFPIVPAVGLIESDGLLSASPTGEGFPSAVSASEGGLLVATRLGASRVRGVRLGPRPSAERGPTVVAARINGSPVPLGDAVTATAESAALELDVVAPTLTSPSRVALAYRIRGHDDTWRAAPPARRTLTFTELPAGSYALEIRASDGQGRWLPRAALVHVHVAPPLHRRWWFISACVGVALLTGFAAHRARLGRQRARFAALTADRARVARELHDGLGQAFTAVGLQIDAAGQWLDTAPARARPHLEQARAMVKHAKRDLRHAIWDLRSAELDPMPLPRVLDALVKELRAQAPAGVELVFSASGPPLPRAALVEHELQQLTREAITNALRHARGLGRVDVALANDGRRLEVVVRDDGEGMDIDPANLAADGHFGIVGMLERGKRIGAEIRWSRAAPRGTEVCIQMPIDLVSQEAS